MNAVLDSEPAPQLVVLNGDLITGENTYLSNSSFYVDEIVRPLVSRNLTWASTYGNHDTQYNLSREAIFEREHRYANAITGNMVSGSNAGVSNYYIPVYSSNWTQRGLPTADQVPEMILWFFDSRGGAAYQQLDSSGNTIPVPEWVDASVADWLKSTSAELQKKYGAANGNRTVPSLAFFHIPVQAMLAFQDQGVNNNTEPGINDDVPLAQQGLSTETGEYIGADVPFMEALLSIPNLIATFSGHDHGDDWCFKWNSQLPGMDLTGNGMNMCFGRHTGYGGYGNWMRGARQILVSEEMLKTGEVDTWVRLEDGSRSGRVRLNATYGEDAYSVVKESFTYLPDS